MYFSDHTIDVHSILQHRQIDQRRSGVCSCNNNVSLSDTFIDGVHAANFYGWIFELMPQTVEFVIQFLSPTLGAIPQVDLAQMFECGKADGMNSSLNDACESESSKTVSPYLRWLTHLNTASDNCQHTVNVTITSGAQIIGGHDRRGCCSPCSYFGAGHYCLQFTRLRVQHENIGQNIRQRWAQLAVATKWCHQFTCQRADFVGGNAGQCVIADVTGHREENAYNILGKYV